MELIKKDQQEELITQRLEKARRESAHLQKINVDIFAKID